MSNQTKGNSAQEPQVPEAPKQPVPSKDGPREVKREHGSVRTDY